MKEGKMQDVEVIEVKNAPNLTTLLQVWHGMNYVTRIQGPTFLSNKEIFVWIFLPFLSVNVN